MAIEVELFDDLDAVAHDAAGALDRAHQSSLHDRLDWFSLTREEIAPDTRLVIARAEEGDHRAWLFLADDAGRRAEALASWYTLAFRPIFAGRPDDVRRIELLAAIGRALGPRFDRLTFAPLPEGDARSLADGFGAAGWRSASDQATVNWRADVSGKSFEEYWQARPGEVRSTVRRKAATPSLRYRLHDSFDAELWADYERVYARSWKPAEGSPAFLRRLAEMEGAAGTLRLGALYRNDVPIAAQFWLVENKVATIHKLAHVEEAKAFSPGTLLSAAMFRHVIDGDRPNVIDFGTGDDAYKADWMDGAVPLYHLDLYRVGTIADRLGSARDALSRLVRGPGVH